MESVFIVSAFFAGLLLKLPAASSGDCARYFGSKTKPYLLERLSAVVCINTFGV